MRCMREKNLACQIISLSIQENVQCLVVFTMPVWFQSQSRSSHRLIACKRSGLLPLAAKVRSVLRAAN